jgi:hypothetical protein
VVTLTASAVVVAVVSVKNEDSVQWRRQRSMAMTID